MRKKPFRIIVNISLCVLVLILIIIPLTGYLKNGPYLNYILNRLPLQNYLAILYVFAYFYLYLKFYKYIADKYKLISSLLFIIPLLLIFRSCNLELAIIINLLYFNTFFFLGTVLFNNQKREPDVMKFSTNILFGIILFVLISLFLSIFNFATGEVLLGLVVLGSIFSFLFKRNIVSEIIRFNKVSGFSINSTVFGFSSLLVILLVLVLQTNSNAGYDELWYSLRTHELLNKTGSFFDEILYPDNWVAYYPKLYEILIFPLQVFPNYAISKMFSVCLWVIITMVSLFLVTGDRSLKYMKNRHLIIALAIVSTPVLANVAVSTKGDILSIFVFLISFLYLERFKDTGKFYYWLQATTLVFLSITARISALPFTFIFIVFSIYQLFLLVAKKKVGWKMNPRQLLYVIFPFALFILILYRTYHFTGVPIVQMEDHPFMPELYNLFNFEYSNEYLQALPGKNIIQLPKLQFLFDMIFNPIKLRVSWAWYSNFYTVLLILAITTYVFSRKNYLQNTYKLIFSILLLTLFFAISLISFGNMPYYGGDGNYFVVPIIVSSLLLASIYTRNTTKNYPILFVAMLYLFLHLGLTLVTGSNWDPWFNRIASSLTYAPHKGDLNKDILVKRANSIYNVDDIFNQLSGVKKTYLAGVGDERRNFLLGHSYLNMRNTRPYVKQDFEHFANFLEKANIEYLLVQNFPNKSKYYQFTQQLLKNPDVISYRGITMTLLDIRAYNYADDLVEQKETALSKIKVNKPDLVYKPDEILPGWNKPFQYSIRNKFNKNKYYENPVTLLSNGSACSFDFINPSASDLNINLIFSTHHDSKKVHGAGQLQILIINEENQVIKNETIDISHNEVYSPIYHIKQLPEGIYRIEFHFDIGSWSRWIRIAISDPVINKC